MKQTLRRLALTLAVVWLVQGCLLAIGLTDVPVNLRTDGLYARVKPRMR